MIVGQRSVGRCEVGRARHDAVIRARRERIALAHQHRNRFGLQKSRQFARAGAVELLAAMTRQLARGVTVQVEDWIALEIDQLRGRPGFVDGLRLHALSDLIFRPYDHVLTSTIAETDIVLQRTLQRMLPEKIQHRRHPFLRPSHVIAKTNHRPRRSRGRLVGSLRIGPARIRTCVNPLMMIVENHVVDNHSGCSSADSPSARRWDRCRRRRRRCERASFVRRD